MIKLTIIFTAQNARTLGNNSRIEMIRYFAKHFNICIITNKKAFIKKQFNNCRIVGIENNRKIKFPFLSDLFLWKNIAKVTNEIGADFVFMIVDTSPVTLWLPLPVFQYVHQYGRRSEKRENFVKMIYRLILKQFYDYFYINGLRKSSAVFVVSKPIIELLKSKGVKNLIHTPHGVDLNKFQNPLINEFHGKLKVLKSNGYFIITYTGWVTENRGYQLMMDSIKEITKMDKNVVLVIAGADKKFSDRTVDFARENHLEDNILNLGILDASLIPGILHLSDVCLSFLDDVPAFKISPPQKVIEYFAAGKPVICNKIQTHEWLVEDGVTGFVTKYTAKDVSDKVLKLMRDKELLKTMSQNAFKESQNYDINTIYGNMVNQIKEELNVHKN